MKLIKAILLLYIFITPSLFGQDSDLRRQIENTINYNLNVEVKCVPGFIVGLMDDYKTCVEVFGPKPGTKIELKKDDYFEIKNISTAITFEVASLLDEKDKIEAKKRKNHFLPVDLQNPNLDQLALSNHLYIENVLPKIIPGLVTRETKGHFPNGRIFKDVLLSFYSDFVTEEYLANSDSNSEYGLLKTCLGKAFNKDFRTNLNKTIITHPDACFLVNKV